MLRLLSALLLLPAVVAAEISVPVGFEAQLVHSGVGGGSRHIAVSALGDIYVRQRANPGIVAIRGDHLERFEQTSGTGIALFKGYLYYSSTTEIFRQKFKSNELVPSGARETVVSGMPGVGGHAAKPFTFDESGHLYVTLGAPSNACQRSQRTKGSPGLNPCPQLKEGAGVWRFASGVLNQQFPKDGIRYVTGMRNAVALRWNPTVGHLYLVQHGRDQLNQLFPEYFTAAQSAELPAEEFHQVSAGANLGWPYTYFDQLRGERMVAPEYGGDGKTVSKDDRFQRPLIGFPGHWAPNDLVFYTGTAFPKRFHGGAFIAFHGSWNRAPFPQQGYKVVFVPFRDGKSDGSYEVFADGFSGNSKLASPGEAEFRPMSLALGPKGELFIGDSQKGRIWKVVYGAK
ncbi:MAG: PQQ-dependent sugar dehydrogenase [Bdellovibrionales bacterium]|nr:PQQ-dependent sugar dehydrogenase [Bdellovibrionales bacterium]